MNNLKKEKALSTEFFKKSMVSEDTLINLEYTFKILIQFYECKNIDLITIFIMNL